MSAAEATATTPPPKSSKKWKVIAALVLLATGGGGVAWWMSGRHAGPAHAEPKPVPKPIFSVLEPFTVNLRDERGERFAQIGVTLQIADSGVDDLIKERLPAVRNNVLLLISGKRIEELLTPEGKAQLAAEIRQQVGQALGWKPAAATAEGGAGAGRPPAPAAAAANPVSSVLFSQFIVQ